MNKKIIILAIICTTFSTLTPPSISLKNQYAYAYSNDEISNLSFTSGFSWIQLYSSLSCKKDYKIKSGDTIPTIAYSKLNSTQSSINLDKIETKAADIRIFVGNDNIKLEDIHSTINISPGEQKLIHIRLYNSKSSTDDDYINEYLIIINREINDDDTYLGNNTITLKEYDNIYLDSLTLYDETQSNDQKIDFNFDKTQPIFNLNVPKDISYIKIKSVPEQQCYNIRINDDKIDNHGNDKYEKYLSLDEGLNIIKIRIVENDSHANREYYLIITRGVNAPQGNFTNSQNSPIQSNITYQLKKNDGTIVTGWTNIGDELYYFDASGTLKTGWLKDVSGNWYYLKDSGVMAKDTVVDGYKLDSTGACVDK